MKAIVIVIALVLVVGAGAWYFMQMPVADAPVTDPSTPSVPVASFPGTAYSSDGLGITLSYDPSFTVTEHAPDNIQIWKWGPTQKGQTEVYDGVIVSFQKINLMGSLDEHVAKRLKEVAGIGAITAPPIKRDFNGRSALTYSISALGNFTVIAVPLKEKSMLEITVMAPDPTKAGFQAEADALLASVRFLP